MYLSAPQPDHSLSMPMYVFFSGHEQTVKNHMCGPGVWPHYLLHFILSGSGTFTSGDRTLKLSAGDAFLIIPGIVSSYKSNNKTPWEYCWIGFDGRDVKIALDSCRLSEKNPVVNFGSKASAAKEILFSVNDALAANPHNSYLHLSLLYRLFSLLLPETVPHANVPGDFLSHAIEYIQHNYNFNIRIQDIACHTGIDRTYLYKLFLRELGVSPQQYLIDYRLGMAKQMLSATALQITEISNSCGFSNTSSFCHHFRRKFSVTPTQFRRETGASPV